MVWMLVDSLARMAYTPVDRMVGMLAPVADILALAVDNMVAGMFEPAVGNMAFAAGTAPNH
jgi:hypothetical protein